jgi:phosphohistidine phosphatase
MPSKICSLYLIRHALAEDRSDEWPDDAKRPLTEKGASRMREVVGGLAALEPQIEDVLSSPLVRAKQTADLLLEGLQPAPRLSIVPALAPGGSPAQVAEALSGHVGAEALALVGHEPGLGELAAWLVGAKTPFAFKKGGVCRIDVQKLPPAGGGQLVWFATPKMLRGLD